MHTLMHTPRQTLAYKQACAHIYMDMHMHPKARMYEYAYVHADTHKSMC